HASLVEHPENRLVATQFLAEPLSQLRRLGWELDIVGQPNVREIVLDLAGFQPRLQPVREEIVREVERPERAKIDARLDQRAVQVQQSDKPRELPAPVADGQDRPAVRLQPGEDMMRVLPRADRDDQWRIRIDVPEDLHPRSEEHTSE